MPPRFINTGSSRLRPPLYTSRPKAQSSNHFSSASNLPRHLGSSSLMPVSAEYLLMIPKLVPTPLSSPSLCIPDLHTQLCTPLLYLSTKPSKLSSPHPNWFPQASALPTVVNGSPIHPVPQAKPCGVPPGIPFLSQPTAHPASLHFQSLLILTPTLGPTRLHCVRSELCVAQCDERKWGFCENKPLSRTGLAKRGSLNSRRVITRAPDTVGTRCAEKGISPGDRKTGWGAGGGGMVGHHGRAIEPAHDSRLLHAQKSCEPLKTTILKMK